MKGEVGEEEEGEGGEEGEETQEEVVAEEEALLRAEVAARAPSNEKLAHWLHLKV